MSSKKISRSLVVSKALFKAQSAAIIRRLKIEVGSELALFLTAPEQVGRPFVVTGYEAVISDDPMVFGGMTAVQVRFMVWDLETGDGEEPNPQPLPFMTPKKHNNICHICHKQGQIRFLSGQFKNSAGVITSPGYLVFCDCYYIGATCPKKRDAWRTWRIFRMQNMGGRHD